MKKIKFLSINKYEKRSSYAFPKKEIVFDIIDKLGIGFDFKEGEKMSIEVPRLTKEGKKIDFKNYKRRIRNYIDLRWWFENKEGYIEVIFGKEKVFLTIHSSKENQKKALKIILKFIKFD